MDSRIPGFYKQDIDERRNTVAERMDLSDAAVEALEGGQFDEEDADVVSENVIGTISYPLSVATNFRIDGADKLIPMAVEETSVVAAASNAAKWTRPTGGFETHVSGPIMLAQVQATNVADPKAARLRINRRAAELAEIANEQDPILLELGGGCQEVIPRTVETTRGEMVVTHLVVDVRDAMGGNAVNSMAEAVAPRIGEITGGDVSLRILSNLADRRLARAVATVEPENLESQNVDMNGEEIRDRIVDAWALADSDPYRAATHNKGIMNGIDAVTTATYNDWRAIEAGAHAYAARDGYGSLTSYEVDEGGNLACSIELPIQIGVVGGATQLQPVAKASLEILDVDSSDELAGVLAAVGLAQNLAGLRALVSEGIQAGHMSLHAKNIAVQAGAPAELVDDIAARMVAEEAIRQDRAEEILEQLQT